MGVELRSLVKVLRRWVTSNANHDPTYRRYPNCADLDTKVMGQNRAKVTILLTAAFDQGLVKRFKDGRMYRYAPATWEDARVDWKVGERSRVKQNGAHGRCRVSKEVKLVYYQATIELHRELNRGASIQEHLIYFQQRAAFLVTRNNQVLRKFIDRNRCSETLRALAECGDYVRFDATKSVQRAPQGRVLYAPSASLLSREVNVAFR